MADTYEKDLAQKSSLTTSDFIRVVGSDNVSYKQLVSDVAKKIIENYIGSSLAGSSQSVKSALDSLNSKLGGCALTKASVGTTAKTFTLGGNYRGTLFVYDSGPQRNGVYNVFSTGSGVVDIKPISVASDITIDTSVVSKISLTATSGTRVVAFLTVQGNVPA